MNNNIVFENARIIYPDYLGEGMYNTYKRSMFNIIVSPEDAAMMAQSGIRVKYTKPSQQYPEPEAYTEISIAFSFLNKETGLEEPARNAPQIILHDLAAGTDITITADNLDVLKACRLNDITIEVSQSTPRMNHVTGKLSSRFYLRAMEANITPFFMKND